MSRLSVYWPDECDLASTSGEAPMILPFPGHRSTQAPARLDVISRARILFENRRCTHCGYPVVRPLELDDDSATDISPLGLSKGNGAQGLLTREIGKSVSELFQALHPIRMP